MNTRLCHICGVRRCQGGRYRTISHQSYVDESLFGYHQEEGAGLVKLKSSFKSTKDRSSMCEEGGCRKWHSQAKQEKQLCRKNGQGKYQQENLTTKTCGHVGKLPVSSVSFSYGAVIIPRCQFLRIVESSGRREIQT